VVTIIVKPERDQDFYLGWSTNSESPVWWGPRNFALTYLIEDAEKPYGDKTDPVARLDRADLNGTSALGGFAFFGRWDDEGFIYEQRGFLPRKHLIAACEALGRNDEPAVWDLLGPLEDGMEVRRG
jgi:hypothetical protein